MVRLGALVTAVLLSVLGCSGGGPEPAAASASPSVPATSSVVSVAPAPAADPLEYAVLGDSYTSGAGTPGSPTTRCRRSPRSYGAQAARALGASYVDVSCSGARSEHVTGRQPFAGGGSAAPQLRAVTATTDLVSIGLGFNDHGFFRNLIRPDRDPSRSEMRVPAVGRSVEAVVREVQQRAPGARVLLVGYPQLVAPSGTCPALAWSAAKAVTARAAFAALDTELASVAERTGATYVDVAAASEGHDVCAGRRAWVNGGRPQPGEAAPYHPFAREQRAVAMLVAAAARG